MVGSLLQVDGVGGPVDTIAPLSIRANDRNESGQIPTCALSSPTKKSMVERLCEHSEAREKQERAGSSRGFEKFRPRFEGKGARVSV